MLQCVFFLRSSLATDRGIRRRQWRVGRQSRGATLCCLGSCSSPLAHSGDPRDKNKTQKGPDMSVKMGRYNQCFFCFCFFFSNKQACENDDFMAHESTLPHETIFRRWHWSRNRVIIITKGTNQTTNYQTKETFNDLFILYYSLPNQTPEQLRRDKLWQSALGDDRN